VIEGSVTSIVRRRLAGRADIELVNSTPSPAG
jgi:hypothetical protein